MKMKRACLFLAFVSLVAVPSVSAQNTQRVDRTYASANPEMVLRVEPMDNQRVRLGTWEAAGFSLNADQFGVRIRSIGQATSPALLPGVTVDSVEVVFVAGRDGTRQPIAYLFLRNMRW